MKSSWSIIVVLLLGSSARADQPASAGRKPAEQAETSFLNEVMPILTRLGCTSGACHGALAGKGGLKLSLRGYDPPTDYFVLTRQAGARRVDRLQPAHSLMLLK